MKVLFLDIDGVINTVGGELGLRYCYGIDPMEESPNKYSIPFDPACLYYLRTIVEDTKCKIVISSTWRHGETVETMQEWFKCPVIKNAIIDKTPSFTSLSHPELKDRKGRVQRGEEIKWWLDQHPEVTRYAVLDDDTDMDIVDKNFFKTCSWDGLKKDIANKVIMHFNQDTYLDHYRMNFALNKFLAEYRSCFNDIDGYKETEQIIVSSLKDLDNKRIAKNGKHG
jgi:hypothetical protein